MSGAVGETSLVSWEQGRVLGIVPGHTWLSPQNMSGLGYYQGPITEEIVTDLTEGRRRQFEMMQFPEGYVALRVVDGETGEVCTRPQDACVLTPDGQFGYRMTPYLDLNNPENEITLSGARQITGVALGREGVTGLPHATVTQIARRVKPNETRSREPWQHVPSATLEISPDAQTIALFYQGAKNPDTGCFGQVVLHEASGQVWADLQVTVSDGYGLFPSFAWVRLAGDGQPDSVLVSGAAVMEKLGVPYEAKTDDLRGGVINDPSLATEVLQAIMGVDTLGLNLPQTGINLYERMGQPSVDITQVVVPLGTAVVAQNVTTSRPEVNMVEL